MILLQTMHLKQAYHTIQQNSCIILHEFFVILQKDNLIELIERVDENWLYGCNVDDDSKEGMVLEKYLKIIKRLPGEDKLVSKAIATYVVSVVVATITLMMFT